MKIELPKGKFAVLTEHDELSEGSYRKIEHAMLKTASVRSRVESAGLDPDKATLSQIYSVLPDEDTALLKQYHDALIVEMVEEWDVLGDNPTSANILDIPRKTYEKLAEACSDEFIKGLDTGEPTDPLVEGGNSAV